jgi:hypothetical protein
MKHFKNDAKHDEIIEHLATVIDPIGEVISDKSESDMYGLLVLGCKLTKDKSKEGGHIESFIEVSGLYEAIVEGLLAEISVQCENQEYTLYSILCEVVDTLRKDLKMNPTQGNLLH